jgi:hypothetical protein
MRPSLGLSSAVAKLCQGLTAGCEQVHRVRQIQKISKFQSICSPSQDDFFAPTHPTGLHLQALLLQLEYLKNQRVYGSSPSDGTGI